MNNKLVKKAYEHFNGVWPLNDNVNMIAKFLCGNWIFSSTHQTYKSFNRKPKVQVWVGTKADFEAYGESLKGEWMPEVGQECEVLYSASWRKCIYKGRTTKTGLHIVEFEHDKLDVFGSLVKFRPLKTESEKQADAMFDIVKDATDLYHACELLRDAGYKND